VAAGQRRLRGLASGDSRRLVIRDNLAAAPATLCVTQPSLLVRRLPPALPRLAGRSWCRSIWRAKTECECRHLLAASRPFCNLPSSW
jgi:hypothetical protein